MHSTTLLLSTLLAASHALAGGPPLSARASCGETAKLICYGPDGGTSQNIDPDDISYAAGFLRYTGTPQDDSSPPVAWTMPPTSPYDCEEWTVYTAGTAMVLAKHISPKLNSSVLYTDMANTIDGGDGATGAALAGSLLGKCGKNGGEVGVTVNKKDPYYGTDAFKKTNSADGIIIKLVKNPNA